MNVSVAMMTIVFNRETPSGISLTCQLKIDNGERQDAMGYGNMGFLCRQPNLYNARNSLHTASEEQVHYPNEELSW